MAEKVKLDGIHEQPRPADPRTSVTYGPEKLSSEEPTNKTYSVEIPDNLPVYRAFKDVMQRGGTGDRLKALRAMTPVMTFLIGNAIHQKYNHFNPPVNPQPFGLRDAALATGMATSIFGTGAAGANAIINVDDKEKLKRDAAITAGFVGLGALLYATNKKFIESGRYGGYSMPWLNTVQNLAMGATPIGLYHVARLYNKNFPENDKPLPIKRIELIRQKARDIL